MEGGRTERGLTGAPGLGAPVFNLTRRGLPETPHDAHTRPQMWLRLAELHRVARLAIPFITGGRTPKS